MGAMQTLLYSHRAAGFMGTRPSTTLAECVCATVFQGFAFGNMGTAEAAAEG